MALLSSMTAAADAGTSSPSQERALLPQRGAAHPPCDGLASKALQESNRCSPDKCKGKEGPAQATLSTASGGCSSDSHRGQGEDRALATQTAAGILGSARTRIGSSLLL